jgi:hypothetical protein
MIGPRSDSKAGFSQAPRHPPRSADTAEAMADLALSVPQAHPPFVGHVPEVAMAGRLNRSVSAWS